MPKYKCAPNLAHKFKKAFAKKPTKESLSGIVAEFVGARLISVSHNHICKEGLVSPIIFADGSIAMLIYNGEEIDLQITQVVSQAEVFANTIEGTHEDHVKNNRDIIKHMVVSTNESKILLTFNDSSILVIIKDAIHIIESIDAAMCFIDNFPFKNTVRLQDKPKVH